jgi:hypothetical protein
MEAEAAKTLIALETKVHFFAGKLAVAAALVMYEGGFVGC